MRILTKPDQEPTVTTIALSIVPHPDMTIGTEVTLLCTTNIEGVARGMVLDQTTEFNARLLTTVVHSGKRCRLPAPINDFATLTTLSHIRVLLSRRTPPRMPTYWVVAPYTYQPSTPCFAGVSIDTVPQHLSCPSGGQLCYHLFTQRLVFFPAHTHGALIGCSFTHGIYYGDACLQTNGSQ